MLEEAHTAPAAAAVAAAAAAGALTLGIAGNARSPLLDAAEHPILLDTGAEVVAGSTRMKAGTAQKIALNLISTAIMIRLGRVYKGLMVSMRVSNQKLRERAIGMVAQLGNLERGRAEVELDRAGGNIKLALLLSRGRRPKSAERLSFFLLAEALGSVAFGLYSAALAHGLLAATMATSVPSSC
ncbi:MAG: hypothetical protein HC767_10730 [Akkermansiaceae bacterium]|nr:hypothetical protein [Akkermansiaceae bacterium]